MFALPQASQALIISQPIPGQLIELPQIPLLHILVLFTRDYRSILPHLANPRGWQGFRSFMEERTEAWKVMDFCHRLYEDDEYPVRAMFGLSIAQDIACLVGERMAELGHPGLARQRVEDIDPDLVKQIGAELMECCWEFCKDFEATPITEAFIARQERYWREVHPRRRPETRRRIEQDLQIFFGVFGNFFFNAIGVMACGESVSSMVQKALAGGPDADQAICRAVRVDNRLRQHPAFHDRYLKAARDGEALFLRRYNDFRSPFTDKIRFPGLYFLLALADGLGVLPSLTNAQLLDLADHAELHRYENRIEDAGYMGKRRNEYLRRKFQRMSMH